MEQSRERVDCERVTEEVDVNAHDSDAGGSIPIQVVFDAAVGRFGVGAWPTQHFATGIAGRDRRSSCRAFCTAVSIWLVSAKTHLTSPFNDWQQDQAGARSLRKRAIVLATTQSLDVGE